jgi:hypothetical protein
MPNVGEEIAGVYLQVIEGCGFIQYNAYTPEVQGEIDVVGLDFQNRRVYLCEVAVHLVTGLMYVKNNQPDNVDKLITKFNKDIDYAETQFPDFERTYMLWSPIVKNQKLGAKHNQLTDVKAIRSTLLETRGVEVQLVVNEEFKRRLDALRAYVAKQTVELKSPVLRLLQIEAHLNRHLGI